MSSPSERRRHKIRALRRRRDFLANRIANYDRNGNPSHDRAECGAITWALQIIEAAQQQEILADLEMLAVLREADPE